MAENCPCGFGKPYETCCKALHEFQRHATTAEQLMRSRYAAYAKGAWEYLLKTHIGHEYDQKLLWELKQQKVQWLKLSIHRHWKGGKSDKNGRVLFTADYIDATGRSGQVNEHSTFIKKNGKWYYEGVYRDQ
jgi:SEC-C motif-containing protein